MLSLLEITYPDTMRFCFFGVFVFDKPFTRRIAMQLMNGKHFERLMCGTPH